MVTLLATKVLPAAGVLVSMVVCLPARCCSPRSGAPSHRPNRAGHHAVSRPPRARSLPGAGLLTLFPCYLFLGMMFASIDLCTVDFAQIQGYKPVAGFILGTYALGSAVGGLWYGARTWQVPLERRFLWTLVLTVAGVATFWAQPNLVTLDLSMLAAGLTISPTLIAGYSADRAAGPRAAPDRGHDVAVLRHLRGGGDRLRRLRSPRRRVRAAPGYLFAAGCGLLAVTTCLLGHRRLRATTEAGAAQ